MVPSTGIDPVLGAPQTPVLPLHQDGKRKQGLATLLYCSQAG